MGSALSGESMVFIAITDLRGCQVPGSGARDTTPSLSRHLPSKVRSGGGLLASALPYVALAPFLVLFSQCQSPLQPQSLLSPVSLFLPSRRMFNRHSKPAPFVPRTGDDAPQGLALYHDVGYGLRRARSQRTRTFRIPMVYSNPLADLCATHHYISDARDLTCFVILLHHSNNWDTMFMERLMGDITMHKPLVAPGVVLALGNGFDFWAIRAAQKWPVCIHLGSMHSLMILIS
jgi:hypothetical protein